MQGVKICSICMRCEGITHLLDDAVKPPSNIHFEGIEELEAVFRKIMKLDQNDNKTRCKVCQNCYNEFRRIYSFLDRCVKARNNMLDDKTDLSDLEIEIKQECDELESGAVIEMLPIDPDDVKPDELESVSVIKILPIDPDDIKPDPMIELKDEKQDSDGKWVVEEIWNEDKMETDVVNAQ